MAKKIYAGVNGLARKVKKIYTGTNGLARKIRKGYIGIGDLAKPFFSGGELLYYGNSGNGAISPLSSERNNLVAANAGNYALFAGGERTSTSYSSIVDIYSDSFVHTTSSLAYGVTESAGITHNNSAIFAGGKTSSEYKYSSAVRRFSETLEITNLSNLSNPKSKIGATSLADYALFAGGFYRTSAADSQKYYSTIDAFDMDFTKSNPTNLGASRCSLGATKLGDYAIFAGGVGSGGSAIKTSIAITSSFTRQSIDDISTPRMCTNGAVSIGSYALIGDSQASVTSSPVDVYDENLTHTVLEGIPANRYGTTAVAFSGFAIFAGGHYGDKGDLVFAYDDSLTRIAAPSMSEAKSRQAAACVNSYALFAGGLVVGVGRVATIEVYTA